MECVETSLEKGRDVPLECRFSLYSRYRNRSVTIWLARWCALALEYAHGQENEKARIYLLLRNQDDPPKRTLAGDFSGGRKRRDPEAYSLEDAAAIMNAALEMHSPWLAV